MKQDIWLISDTHFNHEGMLRFKDWDGNPTRPGFATLEDMDEHMIAQWNSVVKTHDHVYHLGDVVMGHDKIAWMNKNWSRLNGTKHLVVGNHDNILVHAGYHWWQSINYWKHFPKHNVLCTHVPLHEKSLSRPTNAHLENVAPHELIWEQALNVHGHIHSNPSPEGPYRCVCVEQINYTPINLEEVTDEFRRT